MKPSHPSSMQPPRTSSPCSTGSSGLGLARVLSGLVVMLSIAAVLGGCQKECPAGTSVCAGVCVRTERDAANCGECGRQCGDGLTCVGGACALVCGGGTTKCGEACVDAKVDSLNCGACGVACVAGEVCSNGTCGTTCAVGLATCGGDAGTLFCANTVSDNENCGACAHRCPAGQACAGAQCVTTCPGAQVNCGGLCVDAQTDRLHCGASGDCLAGKAGVPCSAGEVCGAGVCATSCPGVQVNCGGQCVDAQSDRLHCGATGDCLAANAGAQCVSGEVCAAGVCATSCPGAQVNCGGLCVNAQSDRLHCGATGDCLAARAGTQCSSGEVCAAGVCATSCPVAQVNCGGLCVDAQSDRLHCGATGDCQGVNAGDQCAPGLACIAGACGTGLPVVRSDAGAWFVDGGVTSAGLPLFLNVGTAPSLSSTDDIPIERVREFKCDEAAVGTSADIADVTGAPGELLVISPSGSTPCTFHLAHRSDAGVDTRLAATPGGYLIASAAASAGLTVACASDAMHYPVPGGPAWAREVHQVPIRCWASTGSSAWTLPLEVVAGDVNAAAWVERVEAVPSTSGVFTLRYVRDSTFQFLNLSDFGRPGSDGVWTRSLTLVGQSLVAGPAIQVSSSVHATPATSGPWVPTSAELAAYGSFMAFDAGACAGGCLLDAGAPDAGP